MKELAKIAKLNGFGCVVTGNGFITVFDEDGYITTNSKAELFAWMGY